MQSGTVFPRILLASKSPRRAEILSNSGLEFRVECIDVDESYPDHLVLDEIPNYIAKLKADASFSLLKKEEVLLTSDTIVVCENQILGKPKDRNHAIEMLSFLSNQKHEVHTSVCLRNESKEVIFTEITEVVFRELALEMIEHYISKYNVMDKAGAYGIQEGIGLYAVMRINGCFYNVMGLPIQRVLAELENF